MERSFYEEKVIDFLRKGRHPLEMFTDLDYYLAGVDEIWDKAYEIISNMSFSELACICKNIEDENLGKRFESYYDLFNPDTAVFTDVKELENVIREDYRSEDVEFSTDFLDYNVEMSKKDILSMYAELQRDFNGDTIVIPDGDYSEIYKGNLAEFIESCNELEGFKRFDDEEEIDFSL